MFTRALSGNCVNCKSIDRFFGVSDQQAKSAYVLACLSSTHSPDTKYVLFASANVTRRKTMPRQTARIGHTKTSTVLARYSFFFSPRARFKQFYLASSKIWGGTSLKFYTTNKIEYGCLISKNIIKMKIWTNGVFLTQIFFFTFLSSTPL